MKRPGLALQVTYAASAVVALGVTWSNNILFMMKNPDAGLSGFVAATFANHASASLTLDLVMLGVAISIWMFVEARRLEIRYIWAYFFFSIVIAIAVAVPIFLLVRERKLSQLPARTS